MIQAGKNKGAVTIRFAGDSGDGMQLIGSEWVKAVGSAQKDLATFPDFPAEIRAPAGTLAGVSGFQIQFAPQKVYTPGDTPEILVALNPAALKANLSDVMKGGTVIVNKDAFNDLAIKKAGYINDPLTDGSLSDFRLVAIEMNSILRAALKGTDLGVKDIQKCKNFFCLGLLYYLFDLDYEKQIIFIENKFKKNPELVKANSLAIKSGFTYGENIELTFKRKEENNLGLKKGRYRALTGNKALALGLVVAAKKSGLRLHYASYPITPASDILHELAHLRAYDAHTFQLEDEMAAICSAIGASFAGDLGVTATSGPGFALKSEALGYATMVELPLIVINVMRAGPSTGMPTKMEQSDLMQAIYGRSGDSPLVVLGTSDAKSCFETAIMASRIAIQFMTPVVILSDAFVANSSTPWLIKNFEEIEDIPKNHEPLSLPFNTYERGKLFLNRAWVLPGNKDTIHQVGGLEKDSLRGSVSYDPENHQRMTNVRQQKILKVKDFVPPPEIFGQKSGDILLVGFGGSFGPIRQATITLQEKNRTVSHLHIEMLNPMHDEIKKYLSSFDEIVVVEHNTGQLHSLLQAKFLCELKSLTKVSGKPFKVEEIVEFVTNLKGRMSKTNQAELTL